MISFFKTFAIVFDVFLLFYLIVSLICVFISDFLENWCGNNDNC